MMNRPLGLEFVWAVEQSDLFGERDEPTGSSPTPLTKLGGNQPDFADTGRTSVSVEDYLGLDVLQSCGSESNVHSGG